MRYRPGGMWISRTVAGWSVATALVGLTCGAIAMRTGRFVLVFTACMACWIAIVAVALARKKRPSRDHTEEAE